MIQTHTQILSSEGVNSLSASTWLGSFQHQAALCVFLWTELIAPLQQQRQRAA